jgi:hypothetical protein
LGGMSSLLESGRLMLSLIFWLFAVVPLASKRVRDPAAAAISQQSHSFHRVVMLSL